MGIAILQAAQQHRTIQRGLIAGGDVLILRRQFHQFLAHRPALGFGQPGQFVDDLCGAHGSNLEVACGIITNSFIWPPASAIATPLSRPASLDAAPQGAGVWRRNVRTAAPIPGERRRRGIFVEPGRRKDSAPARLTMPPRRDWRIHWETAGYEAVAPACARTLSGKSTQ